METVTIEPKEKYIARFKNGINLLHARGLVAYSRKTGARIKRQQFALRSLIMAAATFPYVASVERSKHRQPLLRRSDDRSSALFAFTFRCTAYNRGFERGFEALLSKRCADSLNAFQRVVKRQTRFLRFEKIRRPCAVSAQKES